MNWKAARIITESANHFGLTTADLTGRDRHLTVVRARHIAMTIVRDKLGMSYPQIGELFGRDHTTVLTAVKFAVIERERSPAWADAFSEIENALLPWKDGPEIDRAEAGQ